MWCLLIVSEANLKTCELLNVIGLLNLKFPPGNENLKFTTDYQGHAVNFKSTQD